MQFGTMANAACTGIQCNETTDMNAPVIKTSIVDAVNQISFACIDLLESVGWSMCFVPKMTRIAFYFLCQGQPLKRQVYHY